MKYKKWFTKVEVRYDSCKNFLNLNEKLNKDDGGSDSSAGEDNDDEEELELEMAAADAEEGGEFHW